MQQMYLIWCKRGTKQRLLGFNMVFKCFSNDQCKNSSRPVGQKKKKAKKPTGSLENMPQTPIIYRCH